jgi:hypothetical protein
MSLIDGLAFTHKDKKVSVHVPPEMHTFLKVRLFHRTHHSVIGSFYVEKKFAMNGKCYWFSHGRKHVGSFHINTHTELDEHGEPRIIPNGFTFSFDPAHSATLSHFDFHRHQGHGQGNFPIYSGPVQWELVKERRVAKKRKRPGR